MTAEKLITLENLARFKELSTIQYSRLPIASVDLLGKIFQYTGVTTEDYTQGCFYKCIYKAETESYTWEQIATSGSVAQVQAN